MSPEPGNRPVSVWLHWVVSPEYLSCCFRHSIFSTSILHSILSFHDKFSSASPHNNISTRGFIFPNWVYKMTSLDHIIHYDEKIFADDAHRTLGTKWGMKRPAKLAIISLSRFYRSRVVISVTGLIGFDKKGWLVILWKYFTFSATYWTFCCGAIPCHNLAFVQTDKILSCKMKTFVEVCNLEITFSQFILLKSNLLLWEKM